MLLADEPTSQRSAAQRRPQPSCGRRCALRYDPVAAGARASTMPGACSAAASSARLAPGGRGRGGAAAPDGAHAAVHHVRRRHAVRARARLRKAGVGSGAAPGGQQRTARARWPAAGTRRGMRPPLVVLTQRQHRRSRPGARRRACETACRHRYSTVSSFRMTPSSRTMPSCPSLLYGSSATSVYTCAWGRV